jgi:hypothetical protein
MLFSIYRSCLVLFSQLDGQELLQLLEIGLAKEKEVRKCAVMLRAGYNSTVKGYHFKC